MLLECKAGERFEGIVLVKEWKEVPFRQKPGTYLTIICQDRSGTMQGKLWEYEQQVPLWLKEQDIFYIRSVVSEYRGVLELTLETIQRISEEDVDLSALLPSSPLTAGELEERFLYASRATVNL